MTHKLKLWNDYSSWDAAEQAWDAKAVEAAKATPLKGLNRLPSMPGITADTAKNLKWKSLKWMVSQDVDKKILKGFLKRPFVYSWRLIRSILRGNPYIRQGDFFLYGIKTVEDFARIIQDHNSILVVGFSYCHKPFECPSGRFSDQCINDANNPICQQCFIGKCVHALPEDNVVPLFIPTVHYIGEKIIELIGQHPGKKIAFIITACEMTLEMFGDFGNMAGIQGIGVRLDGRICNTMKAFELSEQGVKPGLTVVLEPTKQKVLDLIRVCRG